MTLRRSLVGLLVVVIAAIGYTAWLVWHAERQLTQAQDAAYALRNAFTGDDPAARAAAVADLQSSASSARSATGGFWWSAMTHAPIVGDDAAGVRDLSDSIDVLAQRAVPPLSTTADDLSGLVNNGRVDVAKVQSIAAPIGQAHAALDQSRALIATTDSSHFVGRLRTKYDTYVSTISSIDDGVAAADHAVQMLPSILGSDRPRDYLFVFQTNAQLRATGGLPGSWAVIRVADGKITLEQQGADADFKAYPQGVTPVPAAQRKLYGPQYTEYFTDAAFNPDVPTAARLWATFWQRQNPKGHLDGVVSLDVVGLSYLLKGIGPVPAGATTLTSDNVVSYLLSDVYQQVPDTSQQDKVFQEVAKALFAQVTTGISSPLSLAEGLQQATDEGRLRFVPLTDGLASGLDGTLIEGGVQPSSPTVPRVELGINDQSASKMSYYLRYSPQITPVSCSNGTERLAGTLHLSQTISVAQARQLPDYVSGVGAPEAGPGSQFVAVRIYGPYGGTLSNVRVVNQALPAQIQMADGRPVALVYVTVDGSSDVVVNWQMTTGQGQTEPGTLGTTPSMTSGDVLTTFPTAC